MKPSQCSGKLFREYIKRRQCDFSLFKVFPAWLCEKTAMGGRRLNYNCDIPRALLMEKRTVHTNQFWLDINAITIFYDFLPTANASPTRRTCAWDAKPGISSLPPLWREIPPLKSDTDNVTSIPQALKNSKLSLCSPVTTMNFNFDVHSSGEKQLQSINQERSAQALGPQGFYWLFKIRSLLTFYTVSNTSHELYKLPSVSEFSPRQRTSERSNTSHAFLLRLPGLSPSPDTW